MQDKDYCPLQRGSCSNYDGHWCYGGLCLEGAEKKSQTDLKLDKMMEDHKNRVVTLSLDKILEIVAKDLDCKPENIVIDGLGVALCRA